MTVLAIIRGTRAGVTLGHARLELAMGNYTGVNKELADTTVGPGRVPPASLPAPAERFATRRSLNFSPVISRFLQYP